MERFWFTGELQWAPAGTLSGGERRRLQLLVVLAQRPNVLLLDEPTNDLDLDTLRTLEEHFDEWPGALVVASHDRSFLQRTTERLLACQDGELVAVPGGVDGWIRAASRPARSAPPLGADSAARRVSSAASTATGRARSPSTIGFQLRQIDRELAQLERRRAQLGAAFSAATDHAVLARLGAELAEAQSELERAEERWLSVAEEAEAAKGP
jgi:ATP-binding cassette subfamily F protein uup